MREQVLSSSPRLRVLRPDETPRPRAGVPPDQALRRMIAVVTLSAAALTMLGLVMVLSASSVAAYARYGSSFLFFQRQLVYAAAGTILCAAAARIRYQAWQKLWVPLIAVTFVLLLLVLHPATGKIAGGSARWIMLGPLSIQPSEFAKFAVVAAAAAILAKNFRYVDDAIRWLLPLVPLVGAVCVLILLQPDFGTATVVAASVFLLLFVAGVRLRLLASSGVVLVGIAGALILGAGYRRARFFSFLHPWADPQNAGYQIVQSLIALGSGHLLGVGLGASRQKWMYVPNAHTDFIFSIMGEELGLVGEVVVLSLFAGFAYGGVRIALAAPDAFGRLLAAGIVSWLGLQALVNLGAVTGILPVTGVPLPFLSFGGSSLVVSLGAVGVLLSIGRAGLAKARGAPSGRRREPEKRAVRRPEEAGGR